MTINYVKPRKILSPTPPYKATGPMKPMDNLPSIISEIQQHQRQRVRSLKMRISISNRLIAMVATMQGYHAGLSEESREAAMKRAQKTIRDVRDDVSNEIEGGLVSFIRAGLLGVDAFDRERKAYEGPMVKLAKQLPVYSWVCEPAQKGFGDLNLAVVVGECGDLSNYANPGKLWARMGCHPYESGGHTRMAKTWNCSTPKLTADEWEDYGYCPRRRAVAYNIGDPLVKGNGDGPYRRRYDAVKEAAFTKHPEWPWKDCQKCKGEGCPKCYGTGKQCGRAHNHAHLLATKLLLKNLWIEWTGADPDYDRKQWT